MKKLLLFCSLFVFAATMSAQSKGCCSKDKAKACSKSEAKASTTSVSDDTYSEATLVAATEAAAKDPSIEKKVCDYSGTVSFSKKVASETETAGFEYIPVVYNPEKGAFVTKDKAACCSKEEMKACGGKEMKKASKEEAKTSEVKKAKV